MKLSKGISKTASLILGRRLKPAPRARPPSPPSAAPPGPPPRLLDRRSDRGDLRRGRTAAAADDPCAEIARLGRELGEVVRRRVRIDDAPARAARQPHVGLGAEGDAVRAAAHLRKGRERCLRADSAVRADGYDSEPL